MLITIITLFPESIHAVLSASVIGRAQKKGVATVRTIQLRDFAQDRYGTVDGKPFGGGAGMILRVDVVDRAIKAAKEGWQGKGEAKTVLLDAGGALYTQETAKRYAETVGHLILICGHYEGVDERIRTLVDEEVSIGPYVLTGGEIAAMAIADSTIRLLEGALGNEESTVRESYTDGLLEYPQYTKPRTYEGMDVPEVLVSGDHRKITAWQTEQAEVRTAAHLSGTTKASRGKSPEKNATD